VSSARGPGRLRPLVSASWERCRRLGLDPDDQGPPLDLSHEVFEALRARHPLASAMPVVRRLLVDYATETGLIVAVSDAAGRLLWVEGHPATKRRAREILFTEGARWDEEHAGTNAPGLALALGNAVRIDAAEHWRRPARRWSCSASPVRDPVTGELLGALDVTGDGRAATPEALALVTAAVAAVEQHLLIQGLRAATRPAAGGPTTPGVDHAIPDDHAIPAEAFLGVLGPDAPYLTRGGRRFSLSLRHAEILFLLTEHPEGLTSGRFAVELDERPLDEVTVRAELSRLRRVIGSDVVASRPYRLVAAVDTDVARVRRLLRDGQRRAAVDLCAGPILGRSRAPGVERARHLLHEELKLALLRRPDPGVLLRWANGAADRDDLELLQACRRTLPLGPDRDRVTARLRLLEDELSG
jgi:hypothetical protein